MVASKIRENARRSLTGKWGKAALVVLVYVILMFVIEWALTFIPILGFIILAVISLPLAFGIVVTIIKLKRNEEITYTEFFSNGFNSFGKVWIVFLRVLLKLIIPIIIGVLSFIAICSGTVFLFGGAIIRSVETVSTGLSIILVGFAFLIIAYIWGMVKYYLYKLVMFILRDNPDMSAKEIVNESKRLMKGKRLSMFWLELTFIGWGILSVFTLGIGLLWLIPYIITSKVEFYEELVGKKEETTQETKEENNPVS